MTCTCCSFGSLLATIVAFFLTAVGMAMKKWHKDALNEELWEPYYVDEDNYDFSGIPVSTQVCLGMAIMIGVLSSVLIIIVLCKQTKGMQISAALCGLLSGVLVGIGVGILSGYLSPRYGSSFYIVLSGGLLYVVSGIMMLVDMLTVPNQ